MLYVVVHFRCCKILQCVIYHFIYLFLLLIDIWGYLLVFTVMNMLLGTFLSFGNIDMHFCVYLGVRLESHHLRFLKDKLRHIKIFKSLSKN